MNVVEKIELFIYTTSIKGIVVECVESVLRVVELERVKTVAKYFHLLQFWERFALSWCIRRIRKFNVQVLQISTRNK